MRLEARSAERTAGLPLLGDVTGLPLVGHGPERIPGGGDVRLPSEDLDGPGRPGLQHRLAVLVEHGPDLGVGGPAHQGVAGAERPTQDQAGGHRSAARVQVGLEDQTASRCRRVGLGLDLDVGDQQDGLEQLVQVRPGLGRDVHELELATPLGRDDALLDELVADPLRVGLFLVDLVDRHHDGDPRRLRVVEGLDRLGHHAVVGGHHQHDDVRGLGSPGPHGSERLVARCVDEGDRPTLLANLIGADVLGDPAELGGDHVGLADRVQQQRLAVVDVTHHGDHRRPGLELRLVDALVGLLVDLVLDRPDDLDRPAQLLGDQLDGVVGKGLGGGDHLAGHEQGLDDLRGRGPEAVGQLLGGRALMDPDRPRGTGRHVGDGHRIGQRGHGCRCRCRCGCGRRLDLHGRGPNGTGVTVALGSAADGLGPPDGKLLGGCGLGLAARLHPAAGRAQARDGLVGHRGGGRPPLVAHLLERGKDLLALDPQLLGQLVDPQVALSPEILVSSSSSLPASTAPSGARRDRASPPRVARRTQASSRCT